MATMNDVQQSTEPQSPTTLVISYLKSKGVPLTSANVRDALHQNALNGGTLIPGLVNQDPGEEAGAARKAATGGPGVGRGGGSSVAKQVESGTTRTSAAADASPDQRGRDSSGGGDGEKPTSAAPGAVNTQFDESQYDPTRQGPPKSIADDMKRSMDKAMQPQGPVAGDFPPMADPSAVFNEEQNTQLGLPGVSGPVAAATAGMVLPSLANLIFGNRGAQVPGVLPVQPGGLANPGPQFGPPEAPTVALPPGSTNEGVPRPEVPFNSASPRVAPTEPLAPRATPPGLTLSDPLNPNVGPNVPFTPRPGGAPRVPPPPVSGLEAARRAAIDAAKAARMFRR